MKLKDCMAKNKSNNNQIKSLLSLFGIYNDPIIGIDIGSSAVKILELGKDQENNYCVKNFAIEHLNVGDVVEKNIKNKESVIATLKKALAKSNINSNLACISIPNSLAISKIVQVETGISDKEILNEIELESDRYIPYDLEDVDIDFEVLGGSKIGSHLQDVILVASKKENVKNRVNILNGAGLKPRIVDIESLSIERAFNLLIAKNLPDKGKNKLICLFDIGANSTSLNVFKNLNLIFNKENNFGGQALLDEIQKRYGLTLSEAINARKYNTLPDDYNIDVLEPYRNKIAQQILRACQLFLSSSEYTKIDYIGITGGTSNLVGLDDAIEQLLKIKVITVNPVEKLSIAEHVPADILLAESSGLMNCCGLALRHLVSKL